MNRRHFLGQVALGSAVVASHLRTPLAAAPARGGLNVKFVGMMGYVKRSDGSMLVALPGHHAMNHVSHVPFLMARRGSPVARALGMTPMTGVVAGAFDAQLADEAAGAFVYRCLDATDIDITGDATSMGVDNRASHLAQMHLIAPGKRLRGNLRRWASATVSLQGGRLENATAHPDAGKVWSFGSYQQRLSDAANFHSNSATIRVGVAGDLDSYTANSNDVSDLWVVSAAGARTDASDPRRLDHGVLFEYLNDTTPVVAYCPEAEGRIVTTELPCATTAVASRTGGFARMAPPFMELCYGAYFGDAS